MPAKPGLSNIFVDKIIKIARRLPILLLYNLSLKPTFIKDIKMETGGEKTSSAQFDQNLESISLVSRRIAHDFNNILGGILGYASFIKTLIEEDNSIYKYVDTIENAAEQGADVTRLLLTSGRGETPHFDQLDLNNIIENTVETLQQELPDDISIKTEFGTEIPQIHGDTTQLGQSFEHIIRNGIESMPDGGKVTVHTEVVNATEHLRNEAAEPADKYINISISDHGCGIPEENFQRIFEPLFTTKSQSPTTGFGLPLTYRTIKSHGGIIDFTTSAETGTTFDIYLPIK